MEEKMRESFIFYRSFFEAIEDLDDKKRLKMYDSIAKLALKNEETDDLKGICKQLFTLIKPQITANNKRYEDGKKGAQHGKKGGRPKKEKEGEKTPPGFSEITPNVNENVNENVNVNEKGEDEKKVDPYLNDTRTQFIEEYKKVFGQAPALTRIECDKIVELSTDIKDFDALIPIAIARLKELSFKDINYKPCANWLLKDNNFARVVNGEFEIQEETKKTQTQQYTPYEEYVQNNS